MKARLELGVSAVRRATGWVAVLTMITACGGGGGQSPAAREPASESPPPAVSCVGGQAIEGGGARFQGIVSDVGPNADVTVSGVRFDSSAAKVYVDGASANAESLRPGQLVSVTGTVDQVAQTGCATAIFGDAVIIAVIDTVDSARQVLTILGQEVRVDASTVFGSDIQPADIASLQPGDVIRLSGLYKDTAVIVATRIDRAVSDGYVVSGVVTQLNPADRTFRLNDSMTVDYSRASLLDYPTGQVSVGDSVRVTGTVFEAGDPSVPGSAVLRPDVVWYGQNDTAFTVFPAQMTLVRGSATFFTASSGKGSVTWSIVHGDGRACTADDCGTINSTTGEYRTANSGSDTNFLVVATSIADPMKSVAVAVYVIDDPTLTTGNNTVEGDVFAQGIGPVPGGWVAISVNSATSFNLLPDRRVDELGHFVASNLPTSTVHLTASKDGYFQPCAVAADVHGGATVPVAIEMIPDPSQDVLDAPRPQLITEPTLSGTVYEMTPNGRQPVSGAAIAIHAFMWDNVIADTLSNSDGNYFLCGLGDPHLMMTVFKPGYVERQWNDLDASQLQVLEIELQRE